MEALHDPESQLMYTALTGERKQSVTDVDQFSPSMVTFMEKKGYEFEANYIRVVLNWCRACDERGLSEQQKCRTPRLPTSRGGNSVGDIIFLSSNLPPEHSRACSTDDVVFF